MNSNSVRHINFLDAPPSAKESLSLNYFWVIVIVFAFSVVAAGYSYFQSTRIKSMQAQLEAVHAEIARTKDARSKQEADALSGKALKEVLSDPVIWSSLVNKIIKKIPDSIKLSEISGSILEKRTLIIKGHSPYLLPIFRLKKNLSALNECENPALVSVAQSRGQDGEEQIDFHLECKLL